MLISNKPNIRGIRKVAKDVKYRTQLIGRDQRLFAGLIATRVYGIALGFVLAFLRRPSAVWRLYFGGGINGRRRYDTRSYCPCRRIQQS